MASVLSILDQITFPTISTNSKVSRDVKVGGTHHLYYIEFLDGSTPEPIADIKTQISNVRVTVDGDVKIDATPTFLMDLWTTIKNKAIPAGCLPIMLTPEEFTLFSHRQNLAWGTGGIQNINIELDMGSVSAVAPSLKLFVVAETETRNFGTIRTIKRTSHNFGTTGEQEITELPTVGPLAGYKAIHIDDVGSNDITEITVKRNNIEVHSNVQREQLSMLFGGFPGVQQHATDIFKIPFDLANNPQGFLPMIGTNDFRILIEWAVAPNNYDIHSEIYENLTTN